MTLATPILFVTHPPPGIVVAAQQEARDLFSSLECWLSSAPALTLPLHLVEQQQQIKGRQVQRLLLQAHVQQRGTGDVGQALKVLPASSCSLFTHRRLQRRTLNTILAPSISTGLAIATRASPAFTHWTRLCSYPLAPSPMNSRSAWTIGTPPGQACRYDKPEQVSASRHRLPSKVLCASLSIGFWTPAG